MENGVVVPLLDLPALEKTLRGTLASKADFLRLLWGYVETLWASNVRFTNTKYLNLSLTFASQELRAFSVQLGGWKAIVVRQWAVFGSNDRAFFSCLTKIG